MQLRRDWFHIPLSAELSALRVLMALKGEDNTDRYDKKCQNNNMNYSSSQLKFELCTGDTDLFNITFHTP